MTHTVEQIAQAIREEIALQSHDHFSTGKIGEDIGLDPVEIVDLVLCLEAYFECPEITLSEFEIANMTVVELAVWIQGFLEAQEG